jgi:hypothetical protein
LAVILVAGAGRLLLSARNLLAVDPGFRAEGRLIVDVLLPRPPYGTVERGRAFSDEVRAGLKSLGATQVAMATSLPLRREWDSTTFTDIVGRSVEPQFRPNGRLRVVSPDLFDTLGIRVSRGRGFNAEDRADAEPVVMVNEAWVAKFLPSGADPLRERIDNMFFRRTSTGFASQSAPIIGVVSDVRYTSLDKQAEPVIYLVDAQRDSVRRSYVITTADGHPEALMTGIRAALQRIDPAVPVQFDSMSRVVSSSLVWSRLGVFMMATFGAISLLLSGTGVFGVLAFVAGQRHREMAVRLSLGANATQRVRARSVDGWVVRAHRRRDRPGARMVDGAPDERLCLRGQCLECVGLERKRHCSSSPSFSAARIVPAWRAASVHPSRALRP